MKAITFHGRTTVRFESIDDPKILDANDVIIEVKLAGICGSDLHPYHEREKGLDHGTVMGHEVVGVVVEAGAGVRKLKKGDWVFAPFTSNCGDCFYCRKGLTCRCVKGQLFGWREKQNGLHGLQAEFARIPLADSTLVKLPEGVTPEEGLLLGDVFSTGFFCAEMAEVSPGGVYAVVGCGPVGLMAVISAREKGADQIYAIDSVPERLALAEKWGAIPVNFKTQNPVEILKAATDGRGADASMEAVGNPAAGRLAYDLIRPGGIIAVAGVNPEESFSFSPPDAYNKNISYRVGRCPARFYAEKLIPIVQQKKYRIADVISHQFSLSEGVRGYTIFDQKLENCTKVVLKP